MKKSKMIEEHLRSKGNLSSLEAIKLYGHTRLASEIFVLRKRGWDIETQEEVSKDRWGNECHYARYIYRGE